MIIATFSKTGEQQTFETAMQAATITGVAEGVIRECSERNIFRVSKGWKFALVRNAAPVESPLEGKETA